MRLSTKFILAIAGTALVPFLVLPVFLLGIANPPGRTTPRELIRLQNALAELEGRPSTPEKISELVREASLASEVFVADGNGRTIASSSEASTLAEFMSLGRGEQRYAFFSVKVPAAVGAYYSVLIAVPFTVGPEGWRGYSPVILWSLPVVFLALVSVLIIRSINRSIGNLEQATRRISEGDLDFQLHARGNDRIASLTGSFEKMRRKVQEETAARSRFLLAVSHDLKTPLASITGYLDAIRDGLAENPEQVERYLAVIRDKTGLLQSRIRQLIDFAKLETGEWKRSRKAVALAPFLAEAIIAFRTEAEARGLGFDAAVGLPDDTKVFMDEDLVFRVLENLIHNAFRYAAVGSAVKLKAAQEEEHITLQISNRGEEIAGEDLPHIFEAFYRGSKARRETGFGLGLSVVKSVIDSHDWAIEAASAGGETCFMIRIPRTHDVR